MSDTTTPAEDCMAWSEHIRMLFSTLQRGDPCGAIREEEAGLGPYDRRYPDTPAAEESLYPASASSSSLHRRSSDADMAETGDEGYFDSHRFPFAFYARMLLSGQPRRPPVTTTLAAASRSSGNPANVSFTFSDVEVYSSVSQPQQRQQVAAHIDEDAEAERLARTLKSLAHRRRAAHHEMQQKQHFYGEPALLHGVPSPIADAAPAPPLMPFADPKVEAAQAALHEEMTELILHIRASNSRSADARQQLHRSRFLRETLPDRAASSASSSAALSDIVPDTKEISTEEYESDFTE